LQKRTAYDRKNSEKQGVGDVSEDAEKLPLQVDEVIYTGCYPRIYDKEIDPQDFYPSYIQTYVERDVRLLKNLGGREYKRINALLCDCKYLNDGK
jgi:hypothetical protein